MATNSTIIGTIEADPVPADRECIRNGSDVMKLVEDFSRVAGLASGNVGPGLSSVTNNTASQALTVANEAKSIATALQNEKKERRAATSRIPLPVGDSVLPITWSPVMPSTLYHVSIAMWGDNSAIAASGQPGFRLVTGSETTGSIMVNWGNVKAGMSYTFVVDEL